MFGYVVANLDRLTPAQKERYRAVYCGLCRALRDRYGQSCRLTLSYDMAFLVLLLSSLDRTELAEEKAFRCPLHPASRRRAFSVTRIDEPDMASAATSGVTSPATASGTAACSA